MKEIERAQKAYNQLLTKAHQSLRTGDSEQVLVFTQTAAWLACRYHFGLWCDNALEDLLHEIAAQIKSSNPIPNRPVNARHAVGILCGYFSKAGGLNAVTRIYLDCLLASGNYQVFLYVMGDGGLIGESGLGFAEKSSAENYRSKGVTIRTRPSSSLSDGAKWFGENLLADNLFAIIDLEDFYDVSAFVGLALAKRHCALKVYRLNHGEHVFWIGRSTADKFIETSVEGAKYSVKYRNLLPEKIVLIPLSSPERTSSRITRSEFGIPETATVSITVASAHKLLGDSTRNYRRTIAELLAKNINHYHILVSPGYASTEFSNFQASDSTWIKRFILFEFRQDLDALFALSDFAIQSFPLGGGVANAEIMRAGIPLVAFLNTDFAPFSGVGFQETEYPLVANSPSQIVSLAESLIADKELRTHWGNWLAKRYNTYFDTKALCARLCGLMKEENLDNRMYVNLAALDYDSISYNQEYLFRWSKSRMHNLPFEFNLMLRWANLEYPVQWSERAAYFFKVLCTCWRDVVIQRRSFMKVLLFALTGQNWRRAFKFR